MGDNTDSALEKKFAKQELSYIAVLTVVLFGAWILSSGIFDSVFEKFNHNQYFYGVIAAAVIITVLVMKVFGKHFAELISKFWISKEKNW